ncbi:MAG TPA: hypothetical protein VLS27_10150 [Gammaproteobacteria bacterium]|nr:hypothetical protein [Gammaproteobacteria bacterium]
MAQVGVAQQAFSSIESEAFTFRSPSLRFIGNHLAAERKHAILDLGLPSGGNLEFFSRVPCTLYVEDLSDSLLALPPPDEEEGADAWDRRVEHCLVHEPTVRFDLIFAWDLINYMHVDLIHALMKRLSRSCRRGTLLYIIISTAPKIPQRPAKLSITLQDRVRYYGEAPLDKPNPRYTPLKVERMMPGFRLLHSFLLGGSLQEFLFSFD